MGETTVTAQETDTPSVRFVPPFLHNPATGEKAVVVQPNQPAFQETAPFPLSPPGNGGAVSPVPKFETNAEEYQRMLEDGSEMEKDARWADVLNHYETALRIFPHNADLMGRYRTARFHYDIGRRMHDTSFLQSIQTSKMSDTLGFYEEIVSRIQRDYVDLPHWDQLFRHGVLNVSIALSEPNYRKKMIPNVLNQRIDNYLAVMKKTVDGWEIKTRTDMKNGIHRLAEIAQQQISLNPVAMIMEFICGVVNSLDPYSAYLTPNQLREQFSMISGNLVGLGVELRSDRDSLIIVRVIQGSPAQESGLSNNDRILAVDGIATKRRDTDSAADMLQGVEGSTAKLLIQRGDNVREVRVVRRQIEVPSVEDVRMLNDYLGYAHLTGFQSKTCEELKTALGELSKKGMKCFVLDMRRNPGGLLQIGVEVANLFLDNGTIVRTRGRNGNDEFPYQATAGNTWNVPLIVLIDEESASAAEIVAGAIRDHKRGVLVGKRSYGKGTIQQILSVKAGNPANVRAGLRLTVEKFYSPLGNPYSGIGVSPNVTVAEERLPYFAARQTDGELVMPLSRTVSSAKSDPFIRQAMNEAKKLVPHTVN